ncbi:MAG: PQQ-dependent sugar dehydrogenase [Labilithrix sp.]|nr:PQQ-dependent sugar dehydrogenase [Labilithrix sp.]
MLLVGVVLGAGAPGCSSFDAAPEPPSGIGLDARPANATCIAPPVAVGRVSLERAFAGVTFEFPVELVDRGENVYVLEMKGAIKRVQRADNAVAKAMDLADRLVDGTILTGFALHPTKPQAFVTFDRMAAPYYSDVVRFESHDGGLTFDPTTEKLVIRVPRETEYHGVGTLKFDARGLLYIGSGDGGAHITSEITRWEPSTLLGTILRIDVDRGDPYAIPPDNPYASGGGRPEIYAGGFRNPYKFSFDRQTGELWAGDVGEASREELDRVEIGGHYGWPTLEGTRCYKPLVGCDRAGKVPPVFEYDHTDGGSVTGGFVYRGRAMPDLYGKMVFGDFVFGRVWVLERDAEGRGEADVLVGGGRLPSVVGFAEDGEGELYVLDWAGGEVFAMKPGDPAPVETIPELLSQTGCVDAADPKRPAKGLVPYGVNVELWSDGADKERHFAIPDGARITVDEHGNFEMPPGSMMMKTFRKGERLIETRLLRKHARGEWSGHSYRWNDAQSDAVRVDFAEDIDVDGQPWALPGPGQCFACHKAVVKHALGLDVGQIDGDFVYPTGRRANQLATLTAVGVLAGEASESTAPRLPRLDDLTVPVATRARAYLQANCAMCHRPDGGVPVPLDLRFTTTVAETRICDAALRPVPGTEGSPYVALGDPSRSALFMRASSRGVEQMPPLATRAVDPEGLQLLEAWIRELDRCD